MISLRKLQVTTEMGHLLLSDVSMEVSSPKVIGVYGPNGSGKTSLLKSIAGIKEDRMVQGESWIFDVAMVHGNASLKDRVRSALYLGSDFHTSFHITVRELLEMAKIANPLSKLSIPEVAEKFDLMQFLNRSFNEMSDGEKQRAMLARGFLQSPRWLILDEIFSKMDIDRSVILAQILRESVKEGMGIVVSSHDLNFLSEISDELWFMKDGKIINSGTVEDVLTSENLKQLFPMRWIHVVRSPDHGKKKVIY